MHSQKYLFHQIVDEIYKKTLHKFETCMSSMHMRHKTNQIDDSIPFVQDSHRAHVRPVRACSCSARARLAPPPAPRAKSEPAPGLRHLPVPSVSDVFPASAVRARSVPLFRPPGFTSLIGLRPPPELSVAPSRPAPSIPPVRARIASLSSPPALLQSPRVRALRPKTHNAEPAQHDDGQKS